MLKICPCELPTQGNVEDCVGRRCRLVRCRDTYVDGLNLGGNLKAYLES